MNHITYRVRTTAERLLTLVGDQDREDLTSKLHDVMRACDGGDSGELLTAINSITQPGLASVVRSELLTAAEIGERQDHAKQKGILVPRSGGAHAKAPVKEDGEDDSSDSFLGDGLRAAPKLTGSVLPKIFDTARESKKGRGGTVDTPSGTDVSTKRGTQGGRPCTVTVDTSDVSVTVCVDDGGKEVTNPHLAHTDDKESTDTLDGKRTMGIGKFLAEVDRGRIR